jgi:hypothetical protein
MDRWAKARVAGRARLLGVALKGLSPGMGELCLSFETARVESIDLSDPTRITVKVKVGNGKRQAFIDHLGGFWKAGISHSFPGIEVYKNTVTLSWWP